MEIGWEGVGCNLNRVVRVGFIEKLGVVIYVLGDFFL